jgi:hypothetical protein
MHKLLIFKGVHEIASLSCSTFDHAKVEKKNFKKKKLRTLC